MIAVEILGYILVVLSLWFMAQTRYHLGLLANIGGSIAWGAVAITSQLWGLLALEIVLAIVAGVGLLKLRRKGDRK